MTYKTYAKQELAGYITAYKRFDDIPEEMYDYLPENLERDDDEDVYIPETFN